jgi:hypothetical protein
MKIKTSKQLVQEYADIVGYYQRVVKTARFNQKALGTAVKFMDRVLARFNESSQPVEANTWSDVKTWDNTMSLRISLTTRTDSLTVGLVPQILRVLMEAGFDVDGAQADHVNDTIAQRTFTMVRKADADKVEIWVKLDATIIESEQATCRKVQTGTKVVEVPVYKLECSSPTAEEITTA